MDNSNALQISRDAKSWLIQISDDATVAEQPAFLQWLDADERHKNEFLRLQALWRELDTAADAVLQKYEHELQAQPDRRFFGALGSTWVSALGRLLHSQQALALSGTAAALLLVVALLIFTPAQTPEYLSKAKINGVFTSEIGSILPLNLIDGSRVELGPGSKLMIRYEADNRNIQLLHGEAYFSVSHDPDRPFTVTTGNGLVTAIGTEFEIHKGVREVLVTVYEGLVEVSRPASTDSQIETARPVKAGEQVSYKPAGSISPAISIEPLSTPSWRGRRIIFNDKPLVEVVADLNRYSPLQIVIADDRLLDIKVNGVFDSGESRAILTAIENTLPTRVVLTAENTATLFYQEPASN